MEIDQLISYLINKDNSEGVVLLGHSTGCQVIGYCILICTKFEVIWTLTLQISNE